MANAGIISYTCDSGLTSDGTCAVLNSTIAGIYDSTFTNANASIYIEYGTTGLASSLQYYTNVTYSDYATALTAQEGDANDVTAVNSLGGTTTNPVVSSSGVALTSSLAQVLGLTGTAHSFGITEGAASGNGTTCTLGSANCYNGLVTLTSAANTWYYRTGSEAGGTYDIYSAVEHETDEVLGTGSCIVGSGITSANCTNGILGNPSTGIGAADLFRYASSGTRSYLTAANGTPAYFSINSGVTNIAGYNNSPNGADYGDWDGSALRVQNAFGTPYNGSTPNSPDITNDGGSEIKVLDAVGYNLTNPTPEPGTLGLFGIALAVLAGYKTRRRA
jgi:hypothetical protein